MERRTQAQRREETRRRLLGAAAQLFAQRGLHAAGVDDIARVAGCSTGALYDHFDSKVDLFLELVEEAIPSWASGYMAAVSGQDTLEGGLEAAVRHWSQLLDRAPQVLLLFVEFWAVAARDPALRPRFAHRYAELRAAISDLLAIGAADFGVDLPLPAPVLASAITALADGFALQRTVDPDAVPDELFKAVLHHLFRVGEIAA
jgi:AcrR family transcriptional regulator